MSFIHKANRDKIIEPMIALAKCSPEHRIVVAGAKSMQLMLELHDLGYVRTTSTGNCGLPTGQYEVLLVDWRRRTLGALDSALDWLVTLVDADARIVVWVDAQKAAANQALREALEKRGFVVEQSIVHDCGCALSARRAQVTPLRKAA
jgi:hypothetical protein